MRQQAGRNTRHTLSFTTAYILQLIGDTDLQIRCDVLTANGTLKVREMAPEVGSQNTSLSTFLHLNSGQRYENEVRKWFKPAL